MHEASYTNGSFVRSGKEAADCSNHIGIDYVHPGNSRHEQCHTSGANEPGKSRTRNKLYDQAPSLCVVQSSFSCRHRPSRERYANNETRASAL